MSLIHPTSVVHPSAQIAEDVEIGPYSIVEADVRIGAGSRIGGHVTLGERLVIGRNVRVFNYACLGTASQDLKHKGQRSHCEIGDGSIIREFVTMNRATREGGVTRVGRRVLLMAYTHVAHECTVEDGAILANGATLGGEVHVGKHANIGGLSGIHQFCRIGAHAIIGASSKVTQDIPPFVMADGHPARPYGPNVIGLERCGFDEQQIALIRRILHKLYDRNGSLEENCEAIREMWPAEPAAAMVLEFVELSQRGIAHPRPRHEEFSEAEI
ncbi:acyl-ACP--UDP-N-acetylglucosamine O-acyltransferase [bacterium]|nr:acyl-ACP--UDP-N-acetylglucosamine O-acyltransferase [bacterium]